LFRFPCDLLCFVGFWLLYTPKILCNFEMCYFSKFFIVFKSELVHLLEKNLNFHIFFPRKLYCHWKSALFLTFSLKLHWNLRGMNVRKFQCKCHTWIYSPFLHNKRRFLYEKANEKRKSIFSFFDNSNGSEKEKWELQTFFLSFIAAQKTENFNYLTARYFFLWVQEIFECEKI
jgi:hypothetical protein